MSYDKELKEHFDEKYGMKNWVAKFYEDSLDKVYKQKLDQVVYLSPDAEKELT